MSGQSVVLLNLILDRKRNTNQITLLNYETEQNSFATVSARVSSNRQLGFNTVTADGVYRIRLNTATKEIYAKRISRVSHRVWANGATLDHDMTYLGNGVWQTDRTVPSNKNNGYKFVFFGLDVDQPHGAQYMDLNLNNGSMEGVDPKYWYVVSVKGGAANANGRANGTWKIPTEALDVPCRYTIYMNDEAGAYTTSIEVLQPDSMINKHYD